MSKAGWKGSILIWLAKHFPIPYSGDIVDIVIIVFADGTYRCPNCGKSLYRFPSAIRYCPWCAFDLQSVSAEETSLTLNGRLEGFLKNIERTRGKE